MISKINNITYFFGTHSYVPLDYLIFSPNEKQKKILPFSFLLGIKINLAATAKMAPTTLIHRTIISLNTFNNR